jgi:hypothetical protein
MIIRPPLSVVVFVGLHSWLSTLGNESADM